MEVVEAQEATVVTLTHHLHPLRTCVNAWMGMAMEVMAAGAATEAMDLEAWKGVETLTVGVTLWLVTGPCMTDVDLLIHLLLLAVVTWVVLDLCVDLTRMQRKS